MPGTDSGGRAGQAEPLATDLETGRAAAREARAHLRWIRSGETTFGDTFQTWYMAFLGVLMVTAMSLSGASEAFARPDCGPQGCLADASRAGVSAGFALSLAGGTILLAVVAGPVSAGAAGRRWLLASPADRGVLLRPAFVGALCLGGLVGALGGAFIGVVAAADRLTAGPVLAASAAGVTVALLGVGLAIRAQAESPGGPGRPRRAALLARGAGTLAALGLLVAAAALLTGPSLAPPVPTLPVAALWILAAGTGLLATGLIATGTGTLRAIPDRELARAGGRFEAMTTSAVTMESRALDLHARRTAVARRGRHASRPGRGRGVLAIIHRDALAAGRRWRPLLTRLVLVPVVVVAGKILGLAMLIVATTLLAGQAARVAGAGLRLWMTSTGLRRATPLPDRLGTAALALVPAAAAISLATLAVAPTGLLPWWAGVQLGLSALAGVLRGTDEPPPRLGTVIATPAGPLPVGLLHSLTHGPDLALIAALPLWVTTSPTALAVPVLALAWQILRRRD